MGLLYGKDGVKVEGHTFTWATVLHTIFIGRFMAKHGWQSRSQWVVPVVSSYAVCEEADWNSSIKSALCSVDVVESTVDSNPMRLGVVMVYSVAEMGHRLQTKVIFVAESNAVRFLFESWLGFLFPEFDKLGLALIKDPRHTVILDIAQTPTDKGIEILREFAGIVYAAHPNLISIEPEEVPVAEEE